MIRRLSFALCLVSLPALAAAIPPDTAVTDLTVAEAMDIANGLGQLTGWTDVVKEGDQTKAVPRIYRFSPGVIFALAKDAGELEKALKPAFDARSKLAMWWSGGTGKIEPGSVQEQRFLVDWKDIQDNQKVSVSLVHVKRSDLDVDKQPIPISVVRALLPIIDE